MPKAVQGIKEFISLTHREDAKKVILKKNADNVKFKIRCSRYLYTLTVAEKDKISKIKQALPPQLALKEIGM